MLESERHDLSDDADYAASQQQATFLLTLVGSEVAYSAAQATAATLSKAYKTTKNHRSFPKNTSLQGENGEYLWLKITSF
ncbi:hypothetical protein HN51_036954 [Arachis hypogaea]